MYLIVCAFLSEIIITIFFFEELILQTAHVYTALLELGSWNIDRIIPQLVELAQVGSFAIKATPSSFNKHPAATILSARSS